MPFLAPAVASITAFASTAVGSFLLRLAVSFVIGRIQQNRMKKKMEAMQRANRPSILVNTASNNEPIPIVYGKTRLGGNRIFTESTDGAGDSEGKSHLVMMFSFCEGEMQTIKQLYFDDIVVWDADHSETAGTIAADGKLSNFISDFAPALNDSETIITYHTGTDTQTVDTYAQTAIGSDWTANHRLQGIAYIVCILKANSEVYKGGLPLITAVLQDHPIQNVASLPTVDLQGGADQHPVDVLYDYMTNSRYGKGLSSNTIDIDSFKTARSDIGSYFKINGLLNTGEAIYNNIGELLESMNGILVFQNGKYKLKIKQQNETSVYTFTQDNILSPVSINLPAKESKFNKVTADYRNKTEETDYNDDIAIVPVAGDTAREAYLTEDNNVELEGRIRLDLVDDTTLVQNIANYQMDETRYQMTITFSAPHTALSIECGEIITMQLEEFGWGSGKQFRVASMGITADNTIEIVAQEYESSIQLV